MKMVSNDEMEIQLVFSITIIVVNKHKCPFYYYNEMVIWFLPQFTSPNYMYRLRIVIG